MFKNILLLALVALLPSIAHGEFKSLSDTKFILNHSPDGAGVQLGTQVTDKKVHILRAQYSYAVVGGSSGAINLRDVDNLAAKIPNGAIVTDCIIDVVTAPTSSGPNQGPTLAFSTGQGAGDLKVAAVYGGYSGLMACVPVGSAATSIKMTAKRTPTITITTASTTTTHALTAGKINVFIQYLLSE